MSQWLDDAALSEKAAARAESALTKAARPGRSVSAIVGSAAVGLAAAMGALAYYNIRKTRQTKASIPRSVGSSTSTACAALHRQGEGRCRHAHPWQSDACEDFLLSGIVDSLRSATGSSSSIAPASI